MPSDTQKASCGLDGRVALITGASGGLGRIVCDVFRERGAIVVGADLAGEADVVCDVSTVEGNQSMVGHTLERCGRLDILVLNAGAQYLAPLAEFPVAEWDRLMGVMVRGPFLAIKEAWGALTERFGGRVLITASTSSFIAEQHKAAYVAAKHAVLGLAKVTALEGAPLGLTANSVAPSWMNTPLVARQIDERSRSGNQPREEIVAQVLAQHPISRFVDPREVADVLAFLASPAASGISGTCVPVDLGALS